MVNHLTAVLRVWIMNESEFSDEGLDEFEESVEDTPIKKKVGFFVSSWILFQFIFVGQNTTYTNKPYDEAYELSQDLSMAESFDGRDKVDIIVDFIWHFLNEQANRLIVRKNFKTTNMMKSLK